MAVLNTLKKPYTRKLSDKDKKIANQRLSLRVSHLGKGGPMARAKTPEYTPQPHEEIPEYTLQPEEKTPEYTPQLDDEMVEDNFDTKSEDDLLINCGIVFVFPS